MADTELRGGWNAKGEDAADVGQSSRCEGNDTGGMGWWNIEPNVGRVAHGMASRVHRLKGLGNGQVPLQAAVAYSMLTELFE